MYETLEAAMTAEAFTNDQRSVTLTSMLSLYYMLIRVYGL